MVEPGLEATVTEVVTEAMTAGAMGSGDVPVLATPAVVALAERAACAAIGDRLPDGRTSVGSRVEIDHLVPTALGVPVSATARLVHVDGATLVFGVEVADLDGIVARGTHRRVVVNREGFLRRAADRGGHAG